MVTTLRLESSWTSRILLATLWCAVAGCRNEGRPEVVLPPEQVGSASPSASSAQDDTSPVPQAQPITEAPAEKEPSAPAAAIVWVKNTASLGGFRSFWVEQGHAPPVYQSQRPILVAVAPDSLWRVNTTKVKSCPHLLKDAEGSRVLPVRVVTTMLDMPLLQRLSDGRELAPWQKGNGYPTVGTACDSNDHVPNDPDSRWDVDHVVGVSFDGGAGHFVVARFHRHTKALYWATDYFASQHYTFDLARGVEVPLSEQTDWDRADMRNAGELKRALDSGGDGDPTGSNASSKQRLTFLSDLPQYGPTGALLTTFRYSCPTVGAAADPEVGRYERGISITSHVPPDPLVPFAKLPGWVVPVMSSLKSQHAFVIPAGKEAAFRAQFEALPATVPQPPDPHPRLY